MARRRALYTFRASSCFFVANPIEDRIIRAHPCHPRQKSDRALIEQKATKASEKLKAEN
jgi:hypothetical protein